jgi:hypothetical protein
MKPRDNHNHDLLVEKSKHVHYEIQQFEDKSLRLARFADRDDIEEYVVHSVFESFLVHSRVVYEFLFQRSSRDSDIRSDDFKDNVSYPLPNPDGYLKDWSTYVTAKRLMHLTTDRLEMSGNKHEWEINKIYVPMHKQLLAFYRWVPDEHICVDLQRLKESELLEADIADEGKPRGDNSITPWGFNLVVDTSGQNLVVTKK